MIKAWKFDGHLAYEKFFSDCMIQTIQKQVLDENLPQAIISIPIAKKRCQERGFNQAMQLSKAIAKHFKIKRLDSTVNAYHQDQHQSALSAEERIRHLKNIFYLKKPPKLPEHVAIIDDVMTTGSTLNTMAQLLMSNGAKRIDYWGIARVCLRLDLGSSPG
jgi:ComF family protein